MAFQYDVNNVGGANGGAEVFFALKELLVTAGWDVKASGGGTGSGLFNATGDVITTAALMNVNLAWFVIRAPAAMAPRREFLVQRGSTNVLWRVAVSAEDGFTNPGGADEDTVFTSTDQQFLVGAATPTFATWFDTAATYKYHVGADDTDPWGFYFFCIPNGGGAARSFGILDPLAPTSFDSLDQDPAIYTWAATNATRIGASSLNLTSGIAKGWWKKDLAGETFVSYHGMEYVNGSAGCIPATTSGLGTNPYDGDHNYWPIAYARGGAEGTIGWKGFGTVLQWTASIRTDMDTLSALGVKDHVCLGVGCVLPWPDVVPVV